MVGKGCVNITSITVITNITTIYSLVVHMISTHRLSCGAYHPLTDTAYPPDSHVFSPFTFSLAVCPLTIIFLILSHIVPLHILRRRYTVIPGENYLRPTDQNNLQCHVTSYEHIGLHFVPFTLYLSFYLLPLYPPSASLP